MVCLGRVVMCRHGFMEWVKDLMHEKNEEGYVMLEVRPEGYVGGPGSDITLNRRDMRSKFGYTTLGMIHSNRLLDNIRQNVGIQI